MIGGGNTAMEEALYLSNIASHVTIVHRRGRFRGEKILRDRVADKEREGKITVAGTPRSTKCWATPAASPACGRARSRAATRRHRLSGVFIAIGHKPNTDMFEGQLIWSTATSSPWAGAAAMRRDEHAGVFAAGDVQDHIYRQAVTSSASGCQAALDAERFLDGVV